MGVTEPSVINLQGGDVTVSLKNKPVEDGRRSNHLDRPYLSTSTTSVVPRTVDMHRTAPFRMKDLTTVSSATALAGFDSPPVSFYERTTRHRFVRNVFAILTLQFASIFGIAIIAKFM